MPSYMCQVSYATEAIRSMIAKPENRSEVIRKAVEGLGGKLTGTWLSFGDYDVVVILELPNNIAAASLAFGRSGGRIVQICQDDATAHHRAGSIRVKKAGKTSYKPIGAKK